jgi:hypothetical protein
VSEPGFVIEQSVSQVVKFADNEYCINWTLKSNAISHNRRVSAWEHPRDDWSGSFWLKNSEEIGSFEWNNWHGWIGSDFVDHARHDTINDLSEIGTIKHNNHWRLFYLTFYGRQDYNANMQKQGCQVNLICLFPISSPFSFHVRRTEWYSGVHWLGKIVLFNTDIMILWPGIEFTSRPFREIRDLLFSIERLR